MALKKQRFKVQFSRFKVNDRMSVKREATETGNIVVPVAQSLRSFNAAGLSRLHSCLPPRQFKSSTFGSKLKVRASRILSFEGSLQELRKILHFAQDKPSTLKLEQSDLSPHEQT
jgi:hypothetical protein